MNRTLSDSMEEVRVAWRTAWIELATAVIGTRGFRALARLGAWTDARFPWLGWIDDHAPKWVQFGTREFFEVVGTLYLIIAAGVALALGIQWLSMR